MATPTKTFTTEDCLNRPYRAEEFPGLERIALENFAVTFSELTPRLQFAVRHKAEQEAAKDMLAALKTIVDAWLSPLEKRALTVEMCEAGRFAIAKAQGRL